MLVSLHEVAAAVLLPKVTVLVPWVFPKAPPLITTVLPKAPWLGERLLIEGPAPGTVKPTPLLCTPFTVTTTFPLVAPVGTLVVILVSLQPVAVATVPLKLIEL